MGRGWCTNAKSYAADLWREVSDVYEDIGGGVEIRKVRAHTSWWDVLSGRITARDRAGNGLADLAAKEAMREAMRESPTHSFNAQLARAVLWGKRLLKYAKNWVEDATLAQEQAVRGMRAAAAHHDGGRQRGTMTHEKWKIGPSIACRRCGREEAGGIEGKRLLHDACAGSAAGRALAHSSGNPNHLWKDYRFTEAGHIGRGGIFLQESRVPACMLADGHTGQEAAVWRQGATPRHTQEEEYVRPWERDPQWLYLPHSAQRIEEEAKGSRAQEEGQQTQRGRGGHLLRVTGPMVWCTRCACHAMARLGTGLKGTCVIRQRNATRKRLQRLHAGRHPVTGGPLV